MKLRGISLTLLILCILGGLIAAFLSPAIAATLALPATGMGAVPAHPTATRVTEPGNLPTQMPNGMMVLARDTFQRTDQAFWGTSSDGRPWSADANINPAFSIFDHTGQISNGTGPVQATLDVTSTNAELLITGQVNQFDADGVSNFGPVLRWKDSRNWYRARINGSKLQLLKDLNGKTTTLAEQDFPATGNTLYSIRFRAQGGYLFAKAWPSAQAEPVNWALTVIDTSLTSGVGGIRVVLVSGTIIRVTSFLETSVPATM